MPRRALKVCAKPGCPELTDATYCPACRPAKQRGTPGYNSRLWRRKRQAFLAKNPVCVDCGDRATDADHEPDRAELVRLGVDDPDAEVWLVARCHGCHSRATRRREAARGGVTPQAVGGGGASGQAARTVYGLQKVLEGS